MTTFLARSATVLLTAVAMLSFLLGLVALVGLGRPDRMAVYFVVTALSVAGVAMLMRRDYRSRRAAEAHLPEDRRPVRRVPRRPITFPLKETLLTFAFWYAAVAVIDRVTSGYTSTFTLAAIAPFAAFMFTTITIAGRHIAFRLTAEEDEAGPPDRPRT
ncbi:MAG: hypothetical protein KGN00_11740 [Chloroflexota bacterium]|nr:hypothetical protein [Chloroflexota bacterium]MDE3194349.1 hypothetical protein [Chloroflexota bacterium]